jgi:acetyl esterase
VAELDPDAAAFLDSYKSAPRIQDGTPEQARANHIASAARLAGPGPELPSVADHLVDEVPVRRYAPADPAGTTVYVHGGGWVVGTLDTYDTLCRELALASGSTVLSVGYDLAPEARHPRQAEQVMAVLRATVPGGGPVAVAGDSAGGYLAALAAQLCQDEGLPLVAQGLIYPCIAPTLDTPSLTENATGYYLETAGMRWYWAHYLGAGAAPPLVARPGLPPAYVLTAGFDPLRDEGRAHADALEAAGVPVTRAEHPGQIHGFVRFTAVIGAARPALHDLGAFLRRHLR